jgi:hypothetical protein
MPHAGKSAVAAEARPASRAGGASTFGTSLADASGIVRPTLGAVRPAKPSFPCDRLCVVLVRPSRYDDDGYVVRHLRGTLPSNTLACLNGLTVDAVASGALAPLDVEVHVFDEAVDRVIPRRLGRRFRRPGTMTVVALAGVQTNQFPRARDLALEFKNEGFAVMIGGFHVSGAVAMAPSMPPECQELIHAGITLVLGEVEHRWTALLSDAACGTLQPVYDFLSDLPELAGRPLPCGSLRLDRKFAVRGYGTIDAGRGCPFQCSFCTIVNVQGRTMRSRGAEGILDHVRRHYRIDGRPSIRHYFFTDDNFSRNPEWEAILDGLIALRRDEGVAIDFMMQVDTAAARIPRLVEKAAAAGCVQVFIGMESLREDNLKSAGKRQNRVGEYRASIARWHESGIVCHVGFIIGFPFDTYDRVMEDVRTLRDDLQVDQASFFMLTPLPGSRDHRAAVDAGVPLDADYNQFDSFHATMPHPRMTASEWVAAYRDAWREFYSFDHMRRALLRQNPHTYWGLMKCFLWYRASMMEGAHPMVTGFVRLKDRLARRPGLPIEPRWRFFSRRVGEVSRQARDYARLLREMQELWVSTRIRAAVYRTVEDEPGWSPTPAGLVASKVGWTRLHQTLRARGHALSSSDASPSRLDAVMRDRQDALHRSQEPEAGASSAAIGSAAGSFARVIRRRHPLGELRNAAAFVIAAVLERF